MKSLIWGLFEERAGPIRMPSFGRAFAARARLEEIAGERG
jgi:hypothetical protein